ncbi:MAG: HEAT repeat domain-containing protein [Nitrospiraceae bacterium]|nr:HEAT repeat domain-containing protein [Nitrospiraceae bacterium]
MHKDLKHPDIEIRRAAVLSLKGFFTGSHDKDLRKKCAEALLVALTDQSWRVRKTAEDLLIDEFSLEEYAGGLIGLLYIEDNAGARNASIEMLSRLNRLATPYLVNAFKTANTDVRKFIIDVLGEFRDRRSLPVMLEALEDEDENVRASAVEHLGAMGEPSVVDALMNILENGDLWTAYPAADALGRIGDKRAIPSLLAALDRKALREPALKALGALGDGETARLIAPFLEDPSKTIQEQALKSIERIHRRGTPSDLIAGAIRSSYGEEAVQVLTGHAHSIKAEVKISAILLLGFLKDERAVESLLELSFESDFTADAGKALVCISRAKPEILLPLFERDNPHIRRFVASVAASAASPLYYDAFLKLLKDEDGHVRAIACRGLAAIGDSRGIPHIRGLLNDMYADVQEAAVDSLAKLKEGLDLPGILKGLESKQAVIRKNTAYLIGKIGAKQAIPGLGFAMKDENIEVRKAVIASLSALKTPESIRYLILALADENPDIRASAAISLGSSGSDAAFEPLCILSGDPEDIVRAVSAKALGALGKKEAVHCLVRLLYDKNGFVITAAMNALGRIGGDAAREALLSMLSSDDLEIRRTALKALAGFRDVKDCALRFVKDPDWATRMAAVEVLAGQDYSAGELESLLDTEDDPVVRKALEGLLKTGNV